MMNMMNIMNIMNEYKLMDRDAERLEIKKRLVELREDKANEGVNSGASEHSVALPMEIEMVEVNNQ